MHCPENRSSVHRTSQDNYVSSFSAQSETHRWKSWLSSGSVANFLRNKPSSIEINRTNRESTQGTSQAGFRFVEHRAFVRSLSCCVCSIIPTLLVFFSFPLRFRYTPRFHSSRPYTDPSGLTCVQSASRAKCKCVRSTHAHTRERIKRSGLEVRMWQSRSRYSWRPAILRAVCGRPAAKQKECASKCCDR